MNNCIENIFISHTLHIHGSWKSPDSSSLFLGFNAFWVMSHLSGLGNKALHYLWLSLLHIKNLSRMFCLFVVMLDLCEIGYWHVKHNCLLILSEGSRIIPGKKGSIALAPCPVSWTHRWPERSGCVIIMRYHPVTNVSATFKSAREVAQLGPALLPSWFEVNEVPRFTQTWNYHHGCFF